MKIFKVFHDTTEIELESGGGFRPFVDWEQLNPAIEKAVMLRPDEFVKGWVIDDKGISVSIGRRPGRKITNTE